ncbi:MAG TPA: chromosome segregation protein SMC [Candidatus Binataceae bacterium]|nr:chromosome segregation protein SMC [Candidatus Binataceae bacterium]
MRLKALEIVGFKSFLEPTTISFAPGVTAVVGPNGCGKSNIVDAIRWVLGEQAPTRLRGKASEDLIYAGNDRNPAAGMAEVSLILEAQEERPLPVPFEALSEVAITRRVFRSGDSEYLINKMPCRLKDITELFMAAQVHSRGYAIIEQGKIEEIIHAKPAELRALIEEAAGLALFKGRRELSERKLERVRENLNRLNDVVSEIERQLAYARRQAKKAEAYKSVKQQFDELERLAAGRRLLAQQAELEHCSTRGEQLKRELDAARGHQLALQQSFEEARAAEQEASRRLSEFSRELEGVRAIAAQRLENRRFIERRLRAATELQPQLVARIGQTEQRATAARAMRAEVGARHAREASSGDNNEGQLLALKAQYEQEAARLKRHEDALEILKDKIADLMREAAVIRGRLSDLSGEQARLRQTLAGQGEAEAEGLERVKSGTQAVAQAQAELEQRRASIAEQEADQVAANEAELEARGAREQAAARLKAAREVLAAASARVERLKRSAAGERLRSVLESLNGDRPAQTPRFLQEVIRAPRELEPAMRAVLGDQLSSVIVDSPNFALRAIEILKRNRKGRLSFVPPPATAEPRHCLSAAGISGRLVEMLTVQPGYESVAEALLGQVLVADDLSSALAAASLNGHGTVFVTREGDVVWPEILISGGSMVDIEAEDADLLISVEDAQSAVTEAEEMDREAAARLLAARTRREQCTSELQAGRRIALAAEQALIQRRNELARIEQECALAQARREGAHRRLSEIEALLPLSHERLRELALLEQALREQLNSSKAEGLEYKTRADAIAEAMLDLASRVEMRKAKLAGLEQELRQVSLRAGELESQLDRDREALAQANVEKTELETELARLAQQEATECARQAELDAAVSQLRQQTRELEQQSAQARAAASAAHDEVARLEQESIDCALRHERAATLCQELSHTFRERFELDFADAAQALAAALQGRDAGADETRLSELRARLARIGEVNLAAESEVSELEERARGLNAQREDMEKALADLNQTVQKLNREARQRFAETFEAAARHFSEVFPKLLRGGRGHLQLVDSDDLLEAGVDILVQPPGKKVKEISLLSGGEKALSALALVFSLFLLNPSPFCLLDEVDAPLDEFSVAAFTGLVRELKSRSQYIVITHNQRTMQTADQIHGVTMDQPGVSRIISLKLPEAA